MHHLCNHQHLRTRPRVDFTHHFFVKNPFVCGVLIDQDQLFLILKNDISVKRHAHHRIAAQLVA